MYMDEEKMKEKIEEIDKKIVIPAVVSFFTSLITIALLLYFL